MGAVLASENVDTPSVVAVACVARTKQDGGITQTQAIFKPIPHPLRGSPLYTKGPINNYNFYAFG